MAQTCCLRTKTVQMYVGTEPTPYRRLKNTILYSTSGSHPKGSWHFVLAALIAGQAFDAAYYEALGPAARWMSEHRGNWRAHDGIDNDGDGEIDECDDQDGIARWWGLCHAWTPAALIEDEPIRTIVYDGITFYPSDLKALMITVYDSSRAVVIGGRCKASQVERDETGRIIDEYCRDTNAGSFHVITTNFLGRFRLGLLKIEPMTTKSGISPYIAIRSTAGEHR